MALRMVSLGGDSVASRTMFELLDVDSLRNTTNMIGFFPSALPPFRCLRKDGVHGVYGTGAEDEEDNERIGMGVVVATVVDKSER